MEFYPYCSLAQSRYVCIFLQSDMIRTGSLDAAYRGAEKEVTDHGEIRL